MTGKRNRIKSSVGGVVMYDDLIENDDIRDYVENVSDKSDSSFKRTLIEFKNGYAISIIQGEYAYCGPDEYEIALINDKDVMDGSLFDEEDKGDTVLGYCDKEKVIHYLKKLARM